VAARYGARPSDIVGIRNRRLAYQFDTAVMSIALTPDEPKEETPALAIPASVGPIKRMKIPESGVW
jgi:hypothetical protein